MGPAPGDYDPHRPASSKLENTNVHGDGGPDGTKRYEAHIPRYSEAIIKESEKMVRYCTVRNCLVNIINCVIYIILYILTFAQTYFFF